MAFSRIDISLRSFYPKYRWLPLYPSLTIDRYVFLTTNKTRKGV